MKVDVPAVSLDALKSHWQNEELYVDWRGRVKSSLAPAYPLGDGYWCIDEDVMLTGYA